jgi:ElaB/YqjD/DUF883 family membrane-anchored ribosome-binding protein
VDQEGNRGQLDQPVSETPDETARIREQIEHTRANLTGTIEELQDRLRPENLVNQAGDAVRATVEQKVRNMANTATDTARRVADQARTSAASVTDQMQSRPISTALALGGLTWWLMRGSRDEYSEYGNGSAMRGVMPAVAVGALGYYLLSQHMLDQGYSPRRRMMADEYADGPGGLGSGEYGEYGDYEPAEGSASLAGRVRQAGATASDRVREMGETAGERVRQLGETADQYRQRAGAAVGEYARDAGDYASQVGEQARRYAGVARARVGETTNMLLERSEDFAEDFDRWMHENPLTVGVAAFALGAIAGLSIPSTETEHRTLGPARQKLMQQAGKAVDSALST